MTRLSFLLSTLIAVISLPVVAAADAPEFQPDYETAITAAKKANKPLIVIFSASWCPPCQQMKWEVYPSEEVRPLRDRFVWTYLDVDDAANQPLARKFGVSGIPHVAFIRADGEPIGYFSGALPAENFADILKKVISGKTGSPAGSGSRS